MRTIRGKDEGTTYEMSDDAVERIGELTRSVEDAFADMGLEFTPGAAFVAALGLSVALSDLAKVWFALFLAHSPAEQRDAFVQLCAKLALRMGRAITDIQLDMVAADGEVSL